MYGFEPYGRHKVNISKGIIQRLSNNKVSKIIFPTQFEKELFINTLDKIKPNIIIGLGQHPRARKIRIERTARNLFGRKKDIPKSIDINLPDRLSVSLKIKPSKNLRVSYDAGKYVCNYSMFIVQNWANKNNSQFAFIHIPKNYNLSRATKIIADIIKLLTDN